MDIKGIQIFFQTDWRANSYAGKAVIEGFRRGSKDVSDGWMPDLLACL